MLYSRIQNPWIWRDSCISGYRFSQRIGLTTIFNLKGSHFYYFVQPKLRFQQLNNMTAALHQRHFIRHLDDQLSGFDLGSSSFSTESPMSLETLRSWDSFCPMARPGIGLHICTAGVTKSRQKRDSLQKQLKMFSSPPKNFQSYSRAKIVFQN